jgi:lysylphosphatidylglycerol synthetase-like protein (DUF2156 family)
MPKKKQESIGRKVGRPLAKAIHFIGWLTGVLVALAVGFGMIGETLKVPYVQPIVPFAGWVVVILTIIGVVLAIIDALS